MTDIIDVALWVIVPGMVIVWIYIIVTSIINHRRKKGDKMKKKVLPKISAPPKPVNPKYGKFKDDRKGLPAIASDDSVPEVGTGYARDRKRQEGLSWRDKRKLKRDATSSFLIEMRFSNGTCKEFVILTKDEIFTYRKRSYYLRYEDSIFNLTQREYKLVFHEDYPTPLEMEVALIEDDDEKTVKAGFARAYWAVRPHNLKAAFEMQYVKVLVESNEISKYLKVALMLSAGTLLFSVLIALMLWRGGG